MTQGATPDAMVGGLDDATHALVTLAIAIASARELGVREAMTRAAALEIDPVWVEELILQSYLFAGFPRTLNAAREWRRASRRPAPPTDQEAARGDAATWQRRGEATCATVYGPMYERLRTNIRELHPALDAWMIVDGYGKVLGRPGLDLRRRELCIVAVCGVLEQDRQLHAHLHGALNAGASVREIDDVLAIVAGHVPPDASRRFELLWERVRRP